MRPPSDDAQLISDRELEALAELYDRFTFRLDPLDPACDAAERNFTQELTRLHDRQSPGLSFVEFRRAVIIQCRRYLKASERVSSPPPRA